jgi:hypothetical protein
VYPQKKPLKSFEGSSEVAVVAFIFLFVRSIVYRSSWSKTMAKTQNIITQPAMIAGHDHAQRMPFSMPAMCMAATASIIIIETGALVPVSLFVMVLTLSVLLLVVLISLSGLTGLLVSLVGLTGGVPPGVAQGD